MTDHREADPVCTCGAGIDGTPTEVRDWLDMHIEAARRRGDTFPHEEVPF